MKWNLKVTKVHTGYYSLENDSFIEAEKAARAALAEDIAANSVGSTTTEVPNRTLGSLAMGKFPFVWSLSTMPRATVLRGTIPPWNWMTLLRKFTSY